MQPELLTPPVKYVFFVIITVFMVYIVTLPYSDHESDIESVYSKYICAIKNSFNASAAAKHVLTDDMHLYTSYAYNNTR